MDILHIIFVAIELIFSLAIWIVIILVVVGFFVRFSPAIIGITLGGFLWSEGHDNIAVIIIFIFALLQAALLAWMEGPK